MMAVAGLDRPVSGDGRVAGVARKSDVRNQFSTSICGPAGPVVEPCGWLPASRIWRWSKKSFTHPDAKVLKSALPVRPVKATTQHIDECAGV